MHKALFGLILLTAAAPSVRATEAGATLRPVDLRCEYRVDPMGIDTPSPRLSWKLTAVDANARGLRQSAYRILAASSRTLLEHNQGNLWDSGKVDADQSIQVPYKGKPLSSTEPVWWKVEVWDHQGNAPVWSNPATWSMGLLNPSDWKAKWIGLDGGEPKPELAQGQWITSSDPTARTVYFRRTFEIPPDQPISDVIVSVVGSGAARFTVNDGFYRGGEKPRTPLAVDITGTLHSGTNVVTATVSAPENQPAALIGIIELNWPDGRREVLCTGKDWKASTQDESGWRKATFNDASWAAAKGLGPYGMQPWGEVEAGRRTVLPARMLRKEFSAPAAVKRATLYVSGLGLFEAYLNGEKVSKDVLVPALSQYDKRVYYMTYDVTKLLRPGRNALGVILGNGRYFAMRQWMSIDMRMFGFPKLLLQLEIERADGGIERVGSDGSWKITADGPLRANNEYDGEVYDARKEMPGWDRVGFDDSSWRQAELVAAPGGVLSAQPIVPIRVTQNIRPVGMHELRPGVYVYDMGQNMVGWCRLAVTGPRGEKVVLRFAEKLHASGDLYVDNLRSAEATDVYILKGKGREIYEPRFTYHGFRYVEMKGFPGKPTLAALEGREVHDDVERASQFTTSNPLLNRIYNAVVWGTQDNYRSIPTDCPQRDERQGWLGDRAQESWGEAYLFNVAAFYAKWMRDISDEQDAAGRISQVSPAYWEFYRDDVSWPATLLMVSDHLYKEYGDRRVIEENYPAMRRWVTHMLTYLKDDLMPRDDGGDWCPPPESPEVINSTDPTRLTDHTLIGTAYFYHVLGLMERFATLLGKPEEAKGYAELAGRIRVAFNKAYYHPDTALYSNGTQTSSILPLALGLAPEADRQKIADTLARRIEEQWHGHLATGLVGTQWLLETLAKSGHENVAYQIASQRTYPGWGYEVTAGDATTIWELWNSPTADPAMNSENHLMMVGDLTTWLYQELAGIRPDPRAPAFHDIILHPSLVCDLKYTKAWFDSPYGKIASDWRISGGRFIWNVTVPPNVSATVFVPGRDPASVTESGKPASAAHGVKYLRSGGDAVVYAVGSGSYHFAAPLVPEPKP